MDDKYSDQEDDFVENFEDESLEDDVERQIDQTIAAYNQRKDKDTYAYQPESMNKQQFGAKDRIGSAKPTIVIKKEIPQRYVESANPEGERRKDLQTKKEMFYDRFNDYVKHHHISPEDFWNPSKDKLNSDEFKECLDIIGFGCGKEEFEDVIFDITDANFYVSLPALCAKIRVWQNYSAEKTLENLKDNVLKIAQESKQKLNSAGSTKKGILIRPQSGVLYAPGGLYPTSTRPFSGISGISSKSKNTLGGTHTDFPKLGSTDHLKRTNYENKSAQYLKEAKKKEAKKDQVLALTLNKAKNEFEYDCLAKMGEANELSQMLGETLTYRAYNAADGHLKCHIYDYDQLVAELPMKDFIREYKMLKQRSKQKQNLRIWETLNDQKGTGSNFYFSSAKTMAGQSNGEQEFGERKNIAKKDRQKELKAVLFETMKLTNTLKSQLEKLEKSGLVYEAQPPKH